MKTKEWNNIFPAIAVPYNDDYSIDEENYREYASWLAEFEKINGLVVNGHTGEINSLNKKERKRAIEIVADEVGDQKLIVSGVSSEGTLEAIEEAEAAQEAGADGILLMPPHIWLRFGMKPESVIDFYKDVAKNIDIEIIIHLYPKETRAFYPVETLIELAKIPNVVALKSGTREMATYEKDLRILREEAPGLKILSCHDEYLLTTMLVGHGIDGALIGFGGCIPELISSLWDAVQSNDLEKCREIQDRIFPLAQAIYGIGQPSGEAHARLKYMLYKRGKLNSPLMRPPVRPLNNEEKQKVEEALKKAGL